MNDREAAAWHEAGHAVVALAVGGSVELVRLDGTATSLPSTAPAGHVALAGPAAECRHQRRAVPLVTRWPSEWAHDVASWQRLLSVTDLTDARPLWVEGLEAADRLCRDNWAAVSVVAQALAERGAVSGVEVARLIDAERHRLQQARRAGALAGRSGWPQYALAL